MKPRAVAQIRNHLVKNAFTPDPGNHLLPETQGLISEKQSLLPADYSPQQVITEFKTIEFPPHLLDTSLRLAAWHQKALQQSSLYHFDAGLVAYAHAINQQQEKVAISRDDLVVNGNPYGFVVLERPLEHKKTDGNAARPVWGISWAPVDEIPWQAATNNQSKTNSQATFMKFNEWQHKEMFFHFRLFTKDILADTPELKGKVVNRIFSEDFDFVANVKATKEGPEANIYTIGDKPKLQDFARFLVIALGMAQSNITETREEKPERGLRRAAKRVGVSRPDDDINVINLRSSVNKAVQRNGVNTDVTEEPVTTQRNYHKLSWHVSASIDPDTGEVKKKAYHAYRNPDLIGMGTKETVFKGTHP